MAKRYRRHVIDNGLFVSLREKIAQEPLVAKLVGALRMGQRILKNFKPGSHRYKPDDPDHNYQVTTFDQRATELRALKAKGIEGAVVSLSAWPREGYDRQHPDVLPPAPAAGGWEGMKRWADACKELGYIPILHDQYRDYYVDAPSWDPQFAAHEEDNVKDASAFPGTRFGGWKEGYIPFMDYWDGGKMSYLSERFALGHLVKNYQGLVRPRHPRRRELSGCVWLRAADGGFQPRASGHPRRRHEGSCRLLQVGAAKRGHRGHRGRRRLGDSLRRLLHRRQCGHRDSSAALHAGVSRRRDDAGRRQRRFPAVLAQWRLWIGAAGRGRTSAAWNECVRSARCTSAWRSWK